MAEPKRSKAKTIDADDDDRQEAEDMGSDEVLRLLDEAEKEEGSQEGTSAVRCAGLTQLQTLTRRP